jgi:predicted alpha/beta hydrolase family esterase
MPTQILFIQGAGEGTHDAWDNKLVHSLESALGPDYTIRYPRMPNEGEPDFPAWKAAILEELGELDDSAILIGHSIGGTFLIHALAQQKPKRKWNAILLLSAPYLGAGGWPAEGTDPARDLSQELRADVPVLVYHGGADDEVAPRHMNLYANAIPHATVRLLADRDHQLNNDLREIARDIRELDR